MAFIGFGGPNTKVKKPAPLGPQGPYEDAGAASEVFSPYSPAGVVAPPVSKPAYEEQAFLALQNQFANDARSANRSADVEDRNLAHSRMDIDAQQQREFAERSAGADRAHSTGLAKMQGQSAMDLARQQAQSNMGLLQERSRLAEEAFRNRFGMLSGAQAGIPQVQHGAGPQGNEVAARNAAFAQARDLSGNTANAALRSLQGLMEDRGLTGSTIEAAQSGQILGNAGAGVQDFINKQLMSDLNRSADIADMEYQGGITQRGQDMAAKQALLSLINAFGSVY